jgi:hypothetical protein
MPCKFPSEFWWNWWVQLAVAVGTLAVVAAAIWGDWLRAKFASPKVELCLLPTVEGVEVRTAGGGLARFYHLNALNKGPLTLSDCRILLTGMRRRGPNGSWTDIQFLVPFPFIWSGDESGPEHVAITTARVFDFGALTVGHRDRFTPRLRYEPVGFEAYGCVHRGEAMRYDLTVDARNYWAAKPQTFEVSWDGKFPAVSTVN